MSVNLPREEIKRILMEHGFTERPQSDGSTDLNSYCYQAVEACIEAFMAKVSKPVYKIRDIASGLYSTGGYYPRFTKHGKTWSARAHLKSHLAMISSRGRLAGWEVVELPSVEYASAGKVMSVADFLAKT